VPTRIGARALTSPCEPNLLGSSLAHAATYHVAISGNDAQPGSHTHPLRSRGACQGVDFVNAGAAQADNASRIQPYFKNPTYWQYVGRPVMLLGASKTDHIFLLDDAVEGTLSQFLTHPN
jgi:hypothetical protein